MKRPVVLCVGGAGTVRVAEGEKVTLPTAHAAEQYAQTNDVAALVFPADMPLPLFDAIAAVPRAPRIVLEEPPIPLWLDVWRVLAGRFFHDAVQPVSYMLAGAQFLAEANDIVSDWPPRDRDEVQRFQADYAEVTEDVRHGAEALQALMVAARTLVPPAVQNPGSLPIAMMAAARLASKFARSVGSNIVTSTGDGGYATCASTASAANVTLTLLMHAFSPPLVPAAQVALTLREQDDAVSLRVSGVRAHALASTSEHGGVTAALWSRGRAALVAAGGAVVVPDNKTLVMRWPRFRGEESAR